MIMDMKAAIKGGAIAIDDDLEQQPPSSSARRSVFSRLVSVFALALTLAAAWSYVSSTAASTWPCATSDYAARAHKILSRTPMIDGHNDLLIQVLSRFNNHIYAPNFTETFKDGTFAGDTDLSKMAKGQYAGAFWSAWLPCPDDISDFSDEAYAPLVKTTFKQLDTFRRIAALYPDRFPSKPTGTVAEAEAAFRKGLVTGPLIIEGLHQIGNSPGVLRAYYELGVRYATLNWNCHNKYSDAAVLSYMNNGTSIAAPPFHGGVSMAGRDLIHEMNRMGMIVDLAHVSENTMRDVLIGEHAGSQDLASWTGSIAPPIFSHSSAYSICPHPRNVPDSVLDLVKLRNTLVMVNISPDFIACEAPGKDAPPNALPRTVKEDATLDQVVRHIMHIGKGIGFEHVGIGTDFSGIVEYPVGLEDVSKIPDLVVELLKRGVTDEQASMIVGGNILRVWREVERVARVLQAQGKRPLEDEKTEL